MGYLWRGLIQTAALGSALGVAVPAWSAQAASSHKSADKVSLGRPAQTSASAPSSNNTTSVEKNPSTVQNQAAGISHLQILHSPEDIVTAGDCQSRVAALTLRATDDNVRGPHIVGGGLADADSKHKLPDIAFELAQKSDESGCENGFKPVTTETAIPNLDLTKLYIRLRSEWVKPGSYSGDLLLAAQGDTTTQTVALKVFVRPTSAWLWGFLVILLGTLLSWWATVWLVRRRQLAANELLIARLDSLLDSLRTHLQELQLGGAPPAERTLAHITEIRRTKLAQLYDDKVLALLAGITAPAAGQVTVIEEIEGVTRVVQYGFSELFQLWQTHPAQRNALGQFFAQMDDLGGRVAAKNALEPEIAGIITAAKTAVAAAIGPGAPAALTAPHVLPSFRQEAAVVQRLTRAAYWLDAISIAVVVVVGLYVVVWRNPGFGTAGDLLTAFGWGLGLKFGTDTARLTASDIRTTLGIKVPSP